MCIGVLETAGTPWIVRRVTSPAGLATWGENGFDNLR